MFEYGKQIFISTMFFSCSLPSVSSLSALLKFISKTNQECKVRPQIVNVSNDEPVFYPFSFETSKCSGSFNNINDPYAKMCSWCC